MKCNHAVHYGRKCQHCGCVRLISPRTRRLIGIKRRSDFREATTAAIAATTAFTVLVILNPERTSYGGGYPFHVVNGTVSQSTYAKEFIILSEFLRFLSFPSSWASKIHY
jgi:hypothetical protein